jgi:deoxyribonuclease-4
MRFGRHMPLNAKPVRAAEIAQQLGCNAIQIFASNPTAWRPPEGDPKASIAFAEAARILDLNPVVIHAPYLINLASPDEIIWEKSIALLTWTLQRGTLLGAQYVVFHTGSHKGTGIEAGIERIVQAIERILPVTPSEVMLLLENDVGAGNSLGSGFAQLATILARLPQFADRLGVCLDTAHLWGAGYDISITEGVQQVVRQVAETVGMANVKVLHLNDTKVALGSHRDIHARLGDGIIGAEGFRALLTDPRLDHVTVIMETPIQTSEDGKEDWEHDKQHFERMMALLLT